MFQVNLREKEMLFTFLNEIDPLLDNSTLSQAEFQF